jgi:putative spermidine/putrescine transport system substrate-binding protein
MKKGKVSRASDRVVEPASRGGPEIDVAPEFDRQKFLTGAVSLLGGVALGGPLAGQAFGRTQATGNVVVVDGGGTYHDALQKCCYTPFQKATGVNLQSTNYDYSIGAIQAQVNGAKQWDVVVLGQAIDDKTAATVFQPIDYSKIHVPGLPAANKFKYFVADMSFGHVLSYRTDVYHTTPTSWLDFWDTSTYPGARGLYNWPVGSLEIALLGDGVPINKLYPLNVKRAFASLDKLKKKTKVYFYNTGAEQISFMQNKIAPMVACWSGRVLAAEAAGVPVKYILNDALAQASYLTIVKTAPNGDNAYKYINFKLQPKYGAADATAFPGDAPNNPLAFKYLSPKIAADLPTNPALANRVANVNANYWAANFDAVLKQWNSWYATHK